MAFTSHSTDKENVGERMSILLKHLSIDNVGIEDGPPSHMMPGQRDISLPKYLQRPAFRAIASDAISVVDPDLRGVSIGFIREKLHALGPQLFAAAADTVVNCPPGRLPRELEVVVSAMSADAPTHLFAVYSSASQRHQIPLHPVHALVLAANCANLPPLLPSRHTRPGAPRGMATLPVVPCCIPSPSAFPILLEYLYTQRDDRLLAALLPIPRLHRMPAVEQLTRQLAEAYTAPALMAYVRRTHGLWGDVVALGIFNENLWRTMGLAWEVLRGALSALSTHSIDI